MKFAARYEVRFIKDDDPTRNFHRVSKSNSLLMAATSRQQAGDLVVDMFTGKVCEDTSWLWEWEKQNPHCYARSMMGKRVVKL